MEGVQDAVMPPRDELNNLRKYKNKEPEEPAQMNTTVLIQTGEGVSLQAIRLFE